MRSVILTGVSRGLGSALFDEFHAAGDRILALGRRFTDKQHAAERADGQRVRLRQCDLGYPATLPNAAELSSFIHGANDVVLVHNAAVLDPVGAIGALSPDAIQVAIAVNLTAPMLITNAVLGAIGTQRGLTVLFVSSGAARHPVAGWTIYSTTKLAGETFFEAVEAQYADDPRIRIVNVNPGVMDTDMQSRVREYAKRDVYFPRAEHFLGLHERGELPPAIAIAQRILAEHL